VRDFEPILYLVMGWMIVFIWPVMVHKLTGDGLMYMVLGGMSYTVGVVFYKIGDRIPI
jgi:hemolysin III